MILSILGTILVQHYRNTKMDMVLRQACLDYLGTITARLRIKDIKGEQNTNALLDVTFAILFPSPYIQAVVQTLVYEEHEDGRYLSPSEVDLSDVSLIFVYIGFTNFVFDYFF